MSAVPAETTEPSGRDSALNSKPMFLDCLRLIERLHRRLLDVIRARLEERGLNEINSVQALLLYNIGDNEMTAGELRSRGYYQGSNVSYNLKKMVEMGFISHRQAEHDRRAVRISLTDKGLEISNLVDDLFTRQLLELAGDELFEMEDLSRLRGTLRNLERFWSDRLHFI